MVHPSMEKQNSWRFYQLLVFFWRQAQYTGRTGHQRHAAWHDFCGSGDDAIGQQTRGDESKAGPGPSAHNRVGSFIGPMAASFQVNPPEAPCQGDLETAEIYGRRVAEITLQFIRGKNT